MSTDQTQGLQQKMSWFPTEPWTGLVLRLWMLQRQPTLDWSSTQFPTLHSRRKRQCMDCSLSSLFDSHNTITWTRHMTTYLLGNTLAPVLADSSVESQDTRQRPWERLLKRQWNALLAKDQVECRWMTLHSLREEHWLFRTPLVRKRSRQHRHTVATPVTMQQRTRCD